MSQEPVPPDPELTAIASALGSLSPAKSRVDRDRLMYEAGRASARPGVLARGGWPAVAAAFAALALGEAAVLARRPESRIVERLVYVAPPAPAPSAPNPDDTAVEAAPAPVWGDPFIGSTGLAGTDYQRLLDQMLRFGLDALPDSPSFASVGRGGSSSLTPKMESAGTLRRNEIDALLNPGGPS